MKKIMLSFFLVFGLSSCAELQQIANQFPAYSPLLTETQIGNGLKEALRVGITEQVTQLTQENGFYSNNLVRIGLPDELQKVESALRKIGLDKVADKGIKALNDVASDAVKTAIPIFVSAVKGITFRDAKNILLGDDNAATVYLKNKTTQALYAKFNPIIKNSFNKVGADQIWRNLISKYNQIPFTNNVNPDLTDYVTQEALKGVYTMIAVKEKDIRTDVSARTSDLLQRVFALQD